MPSERKWEAFNEITEQLRAASRRLAAGFMLPHQPGGGWRKPCGHGRVEPGRQ